jgi:hypothetical protein
MLGLDINTRVVAHSTLCTQQWLHHQPNYASLAQHIDYYSGNCFEINIDRMNKYDRIYIGNLLYIQ